MSNEEWKGGILVVTRPQASFAVTGVAGLRRRRGSSRYYQLARGGAGSGDARRGDTGGRGRSDG